MDRFCRFVTEERIQQQGEIGICWVPAWQGPVPTHSVTGPCGAVGWGSVTTILCPLPSPVQEEAVLMQAFAGHSWSQLGMGLCMCVCQRTPGILHEAGVSSSTQIEFYCAAEPNALTLHQVLAVALLEERARSASVGSLSGILCTLPPCLHPLLHCLREATFASVSTPPSETACIT